MNISPAEGVGTRREARERALAILYEAELKEESPVAIMDGLPVEEDDFAADLVAGVARFQEDIDALITRFAKDWALERMPVVDRTLLRIGVYELSHRPDIPLGATISEAVELAKRYSTDDSGKFINGMLARIGAELRPSEPDS